MTDSTASRESEVITPFLKWPGGKRWLAPTLCEVIRAELSGTYFEPFVGAGAVYLAARPLKAVLSDTNGQLIDFLNTVSQQPEAVVRATWRWSNTAECFQKVRRSVPRTEVGSAARFLYLNRTCWGGLFRTNQNGDFNVPFGDTGRRLCSLQHVVCVSAEYARASISAQDFEVAIDSSVKGDVVYADPPYTGKGENNGFIRYNERLFSWSDQERLAKACRSARRRGVFVIVSGLQHHDVLSLYPGWWVLQKSRHSRVSRDISARREIHEIVLFSRRPAGLPNSDFGAISRVL